MEVPLLPPVRIVSVVPSQTELLYALGLEERVMGITKFCTHPAHWFRTKTRVGGTKTLHLPNIVALKPDLILANKEENTKEEIAYLATQFPVWVSDVKGYEDALSMIRQVGLLTHTSTPAEAIILQMQERFNAWQQQWASMNHARQRALYLIWRKPYMAAGGDTFIHDMLRIAGFDNVLAQHTRYPTISATDIQDLNPEVILLSSEPYPFKERHIGELHSLCPAAKIQLVDGAIFSWYGSRLLEAPAYFEELAMLF